LITPPDSFKYFDGNNIKIIVGKNEIANVAPKAFSHILLIMKEVR